MAQPLPDPLHCATINIYKSNSELQTICQSDRPVKTLRIWILFLDLITCHYGISSGLGQLRLDLDLGLKITYHASLVEAKLKKMLKIL